MSIGLGEITTRAHDLVAAGDLAGARDLLAGALVGADPSPANASDDLAEAAGLHARLLLTLGDPRAARPWAAFAYAAVGRLHGAHDERTVGAAATLAAVLHRVGSQARAAHLYRDVIAELTSIDGPESLRVLAAHADLATVEYARGECEVARNRLEDAWSLHREVYGDTHPSGIKMLARLGAMQRDCGRFTEANDNLALAQELCRESLPPDHPLAVQVAALARATATPDHLCATPPPPPSPPAPAPAPPSGRDQGLVAGDTPGESHDSSLVDEPIPTGGDAGPPPWEERPDPGPDRPDTGQDRPEGSGFPDEPDAPERPDLADPPADRWWPPEPGEPDERPEPATAGTDRDDAPTGPATYDDRAWYHDPAGPGSEQPWRDDPTGTDTGYDDRAWSDDPLGAGNRPGEEAHANGVHPDPLSDRGWPDLDRPDPDRTDAGHLDRDWTATDPLDRPDPDRAAAGRPATEPTDGGWPDANHTAPGWPDARHPEDAWAATDRPEPDRPGPDRPDSTWSDPGPTKPDWPDADRYQADRDDAAPYQADREQADRDQADRYDAAPDQPWNAEQPWDDPADRGTGYPERGYAEPMYPEPDAARRPDLTKRAWPDQEPTWREPGPTGQEAWPEREPALPPDVPDFAPTGPDSGQFAAGGAPAGDAHPGVHEVRRTPTTDLAVRQRGDLPVRRRNALPVPVRRPPAPPPDRRLVPVILAGLVVVALGAVAVIAGFALADRREPAPDAGGQPVPPATGAPGSTSPTSPAAPPPAEPGTPPGGVTVTDNRDSVTLTWTYPSGAEGPVVVSAGRTGQKPRAFQDLAPGTSSYVVYGLDSSVDYCFVVAVVYSTDLVGRSEPVCTERG
uniref:tetratricopeptide repeat protein n=1 Tax=Polymorphospora lycopeni TaxID=3140240 RepID=UPI0035D490CF